MEAVLTVSQAAHPERLKSNPSSSVSSSSSSVAKAAPSLSSSLDLLLTRQGGAYGNGYGHGNGNGTFSLAGPAQIIKDVVDALVSNQVSCAICAERVTKKAHIWSCPQCFKMFHHHCTKKWHSRCLENNKAASSSSASSSSSADSWRCPTCNFGLMTPPSDYTCFCGKVTDPEVGTYICIYINVNADRCKCIRINIHILPPHPVSSSTRT